MLAGIIVAVPANRMTGIYLAIATLAFSQIVEQLVIRWESVTRGFQGMPVPAPELFGHPLARPWEFYYFCLAVLVLVVFAAINLTRSPTGRAMVAIRDFEISAQSLGVNLVQYKTIAFALERRHHRARRRAARPQVAVHLAGCLQHFAVHPAAADGGGRRARLDPRRHPGRHLRRRTAPGHRADARLPADRQSPGRPAWSLACSAWSWSLIVLFEPLGIYGRWLKIKAYFDYFPLYRRATFKRQRSYLKTERVR